jgi:hypothetical protein
MLLGVGVMLDRVRADRILHEALATGADPLHLQLVFNLHATTATRYAATARRILSDQAESDEPASITEPPPGSIRPSFRRP